MKFFRRSLFIISLILLFTFLFKRSLFSLAFSFKPVELQHEIVLTDDQLKTEIDTRLAEKKHPTLNELSKACLKISKTYLIFSRKAKSTDPNKLRKHKTTHCVGYAAFFNSLINYVIQKHQLQNHYNSKHYRGKIFFFGYEITDKFDNTFWKDHDFVVVTDLKQNETYVIDPSLYEFTRIGMLKSKTN